MAICEEVQRGLASNYYFNGTFSAKCEIASYYFHQLLAMHLRTGL